MVPKFIHSHSLIHSRVMSRALSPKSGLELGAGDTVVRRMAEVPDVEEPMG